MGDFVYWERHQRKTALLNLVGKVHISHQVCHFQDVKCCRAAAVLMDCTTDVHNKIDYEDKIFKQDVYDGTQHSQ